MLTSHRQKAVKTVDNRVSESRDVLCNPITSVRAREFDKGLIKIMELSHRWAEMVSDERLIAQMLLCVHKNQQEKYTRNTAIQIQLLFDKAQHQAGVNICNKFDPVAVYY